MELAAMFATLPQLFMGVSLAACAGLRAFLPLFVLGVAARAELFALGERFEWLSSWPALVVLGTAVVVEVFADKFPLVDHLLDVVATIVRPLAGALAVASPLTMTDPLVAAVVGIVLGGAVAGGVHAVKSQTRLASTATTGSLANPVLSFFEDLLALSGSVVAILLPLLAVIVVLVAIIFVVRRRRSRRRRRSPSVADRASQLS